MNKLERYGINKSIEKLKKTFFLMQEASIPRHIIMWVCLTIWISSCNNIISEKNEYQQKVENILLLLGAMGLFSYLWYSVLPKDGKNNLIGKLIEKEYTIIFSPNIDQKIISEINKTRAMLDFQSHEDFMNMLVILRKMRPWDLIHKKWVWDNVYYTKNNQNKWLRIINSNWEYSAVAFKSEFLNDYTFWVLLERKWYRYDNIEVIESWDIKK